MLPADTGSVEISFFSQHVAERLGDATLPRLDGRTSLTAVRMPVMTYETEPLSGSLASGMYTDGSGTCLMCEVSGYFGPPPLTSRKEGRITVHLSSPFLRRPGTDGDGVRGSEMMKRNVVASGQEDAGLRELEGFVMAMIHRSVDLRQLCVLEGEACWVLSVSVAIINADGGLYGAALAAVVSLLRDLQLPASVLPDGTAVAAQQLHLSVLPLACTYGLLSHPTAGLLWLADLNAAEELVVEASCTVTLGEDGGVLDVHQVGNFRGRGTAMAQHWATTQPAVREALGWNAAS